MRFACKPVVLLVLCLMVLGCRSENPSPSDKDEQGEIQVAVVNYPLAYFAQRIGGNEVVIRFPAPADGDPAFWKPSAEEISQYQTADLILLNGAGYASWVQGASLSENKVVQTSAAFKDRFIKTISEVHSHGPEGEHSHEGTAFTTWLDTELALLQAQAARDALIRTRPDKKEQFEANYISLEKDLKEVDQQLKSVLEPVAEAPLLYSHPVYQYFNRAYKLNGEAVHWEPGEMPSEELWQELDQLLRHHPAKVMVWEGEPLPDIVARLQEKGIESVVFEPLGNRPKQGDYLTARKASLQGMEKSLSGQPR